IAMDTPSGTIIFTTVGRTHYGFDVFSLHIASSVERRLTDGVSVNFNAQFADDNGNDIVFVSERAGSARIFRTRPGNSKPEQLPGAPESFFHDRPIITQDNTLYFISAHEQPDRHFKNWTALYSVNSQGKEVTRVTPPDTADFSPAVSKSGKYFAVASYGSRSWGGEFHEINSDIVVFKPSEPEKRVVLCERGGWPTWSGDSTVFFHRQADDGWWSIYRFDIPESLNLSPIKPVRVTPPGLHCFTPAAFHDGKRIAVATRRRGGESTVPNLESIVSPIKTLRLLRLNGSFPSSSPDGDLIALNSDFDINGGIKVARSDGSKRWTLIKDRTAFYNSWSPTERHVIYASLGPIFRPAGIAVQIARIQFSPSDLTADREEVPCEVKFLTLDNTGNNAFPSCSPDGKSVVFRSGRSGHKNLYILDAVNGESEGGEGIRRLTEGPWIDTMPCWSPKGDLIGFSSNRHDPSNDAAFGAYVVRPDGSGLRRIEIAGPEGSEEAARERVNHVSFNKDGDWIVFTANLGGITAEPVAIPNQFQPYGDLYVVKLDGTGLRRLTWNGYEDGTPTWHTVDDLGLSGLSLNGQDGDKLEGQFEEPLWITCDI
ncbi:hypothetical protein HID58_053113, partial [Brassica napus]